MTLDIRPVSPDELSPFVRVPTIAFGGDIVPEEEETLRAWLEFDLESADAVAPAAAAMTERGHRLLKEATEEPWGQTVARLLSPDGLLVGLTYTPWMHKTGTG